MRVSTSHPPQRPLRLPLCLLGLALLLACRAEPAGGQRQLDFGEVKRAVLPIGQPTFSNGVESFAHAGSGVAIDERRIATAAHVVAHLKNIVVRLDGRVTSAKLVGLDKTRDAAVIELQQASCATWLPIGKSANLRVGERLFSVGYSAGEQAVVTAGIYSGLHVPHGAQPPVGLLTDAAMAPGSSGGPLLSEAGELVGLNGVANISYGVHRAVAIEAVTALIH